MPKATLRFKRKRTTADGFVVEMTIWELPEASAERLHGLKYSLHCCKIDGTLVVRYDNEQGKGDHKHWRDREEPYRFKDVETLIADFIGDVEAERARKG